MKYFKTKKCEYCNHKSSESDDSNPFFCIFCGRKYESFVNNIPFILIIISFSPFYFNWHEYVLLAIPLWLAAWYINKRLSQLNLHTIDHRLTKKWELIPHKRASKGELNLKSTGGSFCLEIFGKKTSFNIKSHSVFRNRLILETPTGIATWRYEIDDGILTLSGADDHQNLFIEDFK